MFNTKVIIFFLGCIFLIGWAFGQKKVELLNVSYDPTRELYRDFNQAFADHWKKSTGEIVTVKQSHGGSGKQARSVIDGLKADVVTLALGYDIDAISEKTQKLPKNWQSLLPNNASPYTSTIIFLVRKGNPKKIKDWGDLIRPGVQVITPNPKTSGGARWNYLAAWGYVLDRELRGVSKEKINPQDPKFKAADKKAKEYIRKLFRNIPLLDAAARGSTNTFIQREIGDILLSWENEAFLALNQFGSGKFEIVVPSVSILAEPPVAVVSKNAQVHGKSKIAKAYLDYLYTPVGQKIIAKHYFRPIHPEHADPKDTQRFPKVKLFTIDDAFGGWKAAQERHFAENGLFDQIYLN